MKYKSIRINIFLIRVDVKQTGFSLVNLIHFINNEVKMNIFLTFFYLKAIENLLRI